MRVEFTGLSSRLNVKDVDTSKINTEGKDGTGRKGLELFNAGMRESELTLKGFQVMREAKVWEGRVRTEWITHDIGGVKTKEEHKRRLDGK